MTLKWEDSVAAVNWAKVEDEKSCEQHRRARYKHTNDDEDVCACAM